MCCYHFLRIVFSLGLGGRDQHELLASLFQRLALAFCDFFSISWCGSRLPARACPLCWGQCQENWALRPSHALGLCWSTCLKSTRAAGLRPAWFWLQSDRQTYVLGKSGWRFCCGTVGVVAIGRVGGQELVVFDFKVNEFSTYLHSDGQFLWGRGG